VVARPTERGLATWSRRRDTCARMGEQLVYTVSRLLRRWASGDGDDTQAIRRMKVREERLMATNLPATDDGHFEAGVAARPFPDHRPPSFKGRRRSAHRAHPTAWPSASRRPPASAGRRSAWLRTPIWPACRVAGSRAFAREGVVMESTGLA
jgi:hypothetical protein